MRQVTEYGKNHAYILANSDMAMKLSIELVDDFMNDREKDLSFIFVAYHAKDDIILIHFKRIDNEIDFDTAIRLMKEDIENGNLEANDKELKKALEDPRVTTAKILLNYISEELTNPVT